MKRKMLVNPWMSPRAVGVRTSFLVRMIGLLVLGNASVPCFAAYVRASSADVEVNDIYANEWGAPFMTFKSVINSACHGGNGLYLYNLEATPNVQLRNNKMAIVLMAKATNRKVRLDYFYDSTIVNSWSSCYIHGITLVP